MRKVQISPSVINMKFFVPVALVLMLSIGFAHEEIQSPEIIVSSILAGQGVNSTDQLDCSKIPEGQLEWLGDAVMEKMAGSHEFHDQMDEMMGGEGSESLKRMHITMGSNWLGCNKEGTMMGSRMTGPMMMRMMTGVLTPMASGFLYPAYYNGFDSVLILAIIGWIFFVAMLIYHFQPSKHHKKR